MAGVCTAVDNQAKLLAAGRELPEKICQRNYITVSNLLHERIKQHEQVSQQLEVVREERTHLQQQLSATTSRADAAEEQLQRQVQLGAEVQRLRDQAALLTAARDDSDHQCKALTEQLGRVKQDLYATMNSKQAALQLLQEREQQLSALSTTANTFKQQLDELQSENRSLSSQLAATQGKLQHSQAGQLEAETQLTAVRTKLRVAEDVAAAQQCCSKQLEQKLLATENSFAAATAKALQLQEAQQALAEEIKRQREACGEEQAAHAHAAAEILSLQTQLAAACSRAEQAERQQQATSTACTVAVNRAQQELDEARTAQFVAEEAHKTADAAAKLLAQRITEVQREAAQQQGIAEAAKQELCKQVALLMKDMEFQKQQDQAWQFRQLEFLTRVTGRVEALEARLDAGAPLCTAPDTAHLCTHKLDGLTVGLDESVAAIGSLVATASKLTKALDALVAH